MSQLYSNKRKRYLHLAKQKKKRPVSKKQFPVSGLKKLEKRIFEEEGLRPTNNTGKKISGLIIDMIYPLLDEATTREEKKGIYQIGIAAWNLGIIKEIYGEEKYWQARNDIIADSSKPTVSLLEKLIDYKCELYNQHDDYVFDYEITYTGSQTILSVATSSLKKQIHKMSEFIAKVE